MVHVLLINFAETKVTVMFLHCEVINNAQQCKTKMHTISNIRIVGERELMEYEEDNYVLYCIVLMGWSLLPNALRPFQDILCSPNLGITRT